MLQDLRNEIKKSRGFYEHKGRPGKIGGSLPRNALDDTELHPLIPIRKSAVEAVITYAKPIQDQDFETVIVINPDTDSIVFKKNGLDREIDILPTEWKYFKHNRVLHNHPSGMTFSFGDIGAAFQQCEAEDWVIGLTGILYVILPPDGMKYFPQSLANKAFKEYKRLSVIVSTNLKILSMLSHLDPKERKNTIHRNILQKMSSDGWFRYYEIELE
jgi:hypothetical protein